VYGVAACLLGFGLRDSPRDSGMVKFYTYTRLLKVLSSRDSVFLSGSRPDICLHVSIVC
jgi:hypothetical protein